MNKRIAGFFLPIFFLSVLAQAGGISDRNPLTTPFGALNLIIQAAGGIVSAASISSKTAHQSQQAAPRGSSQNNLPLFPGVNHMTTTINPSAFDVLAPPQMPSYPAIALTFAQNQTIRGLNGQLYSYPDQLFIESAPYGSCNSVSFFRASALNFSETYSQTISKTTSSFLGLFSSSATSTVGDAIKLQSNNQAAVGVSFCPVSTYTFKVSPPIFGLKIKDLDPQFVQGVQILLSPNPNYIDSVGNWTEFFSNWGTGQPQSGTIGGVVGSIWGLGMATFHEQGSAWASAQAGAELNSFLGSAGGGGGSGATSLFLNAASAAGGNRTAWAGGSCVPPSCSFSDWYQSVFDSPALMNLDWVPLTDYIAIVDKNASAGSVDAIQNITAVAVLSNVLGPLLSNYAAMMDPSSWEVVCATLWQNTPNCVSTNGSSTCTLVINTAIQNNEKAAQTNLLLAISQLSAAVSKIWISQESLSSIFQTCETYASLWASGNTAGTVCYLTKDGQTQNGSAATFPAAFIPVVHTIQVADVNPSPGNLAPQNVPALTWQYGVYNNPVMDLVTAEAYCSNLGPSWHLPSIWELDALWRQVAILGPDNNHNWYNWYWSSTRYGSDPNAWVVDFNTGGVVSPSIGLSYNVRCVRSGAT